MDNEEIFDLVYEDLQGVGGPMGSDRSWEASLGLFRDLNNAKEKAETHCEKNFKRKITWRKGRGPGEVVNSGDLGYCMYHIVKRRVE